MRLEHRISLGMACNAYKTQGFLDMNSMITRGSSITEPSERFRADQSSRLGAREETGSPHINSGTSAAGVSASLERTSPG
jgi:hypothetical protein